MFGKTVETPQNENTKFIQDQLWYFKVTGFGLTRNYREAKAFTALEYCLIIVTKKRFRILKEKFH